MPRSKYKKRADGRYQKRVKAGRDKHGRAVYKTVYAATLKELERKAAEFEKSLSATSKTTFRDWAERWFDIYKGDKAYNTRKQYRRMLDAYILPVLGECDLAAVKPFRIQGLLNGLTDKGLYTTAKMALTTVKQILDAAAVNELIERNAAKSIAPPSYRKTGKSALGDNEKSFVLARDMPIKYKAFLFVLLFTGLRRGEALALMKDDVNLTARKIAVTKTVVFAPNKAVIKPAPKSAAGVRTVPVADALRDVLADYIPTVDAEILFPGRSGGYMSLSAFRVFWRNALEAAYLPDNVTPHTFRHNFATELYYADVDIKEAQRLLGHAGAALTMEVYTHYKEAGNDEVIEKLNKIKN